MDRFRRLPLEGICSFLVAWISAVVVVVANDELLDEEPQHNAGEIANAVGAFRRIRRRMQLEQDREDSPKRMKVKYDYERARKCVYDDYLKPHALYESQFIRIFRVTRGIFQRVMEVCGAADDFFTHRKLLNGEPGIYPEVKILMALELLAYGVSPSAFMAYFQMHDQTGRNCLKNLARIIANSQLKDVYLRQMTKDDARKVSALHEKQFGVAGCMGCLDCMHVYWRLCPTAWHGQYEGKEGCASIVLEAFTDYNTWVWHRKFGFPGTLNDINIWDQSTLLRAFLDGKQKAIDFVFQIAGKNHSMLWLFVDGIYPELARFVKPYSEPMTPKQKRFKKWQESSRKSVERAFGIVQRKFQILARPVELHHEEDIRNIVTTCLILHNMMVEVRVERDQEENSDMYAHSDNRPVRTGGNRSVSNATGPRASTATADTLELFEQTYSERIKMIQETWPDPRSETRIQQINALLEEQFEESNRNWRDLYDEINHYQLRTDIIEQLEINRRSDN